MKRIDWPSHLMTGAVFLALSIFSLMSTAALGRAQSVDIVHDFATEMHPYAGLIQGLDGFLYGTTAYGGVNNQGTVFKILPDGTGFSVIKSFECGIATDGCTPMARLKQLADGSLYGTTSAGGVNNQGTVFKILPDGTFSVIHSFSCETEGCYPLAELIQGQGTDEFLYGTAALGGPSNGGIVFKISPDGAFSVIYSFQCSINFSCSPYAGLIQDTDGFLYGTTVATSGNVAGTVFRISTDGTVFSVIHRFQGGAADGDLPYAGLIEGIDGFLYGTTQDGGTANAGTVFKILPDGTGFSVIKSFQGGATDGRSPLAELIQLSDGSLYGTTRFGGANDSGTLFKILPDGTFSIIDSFGCSGTDDGCDPQVRLIKASDGTLYSTTPAGGFFGSGTIFRVIIDTQATPVITWNNPADITYGTALSDATQLNATANVAGVFTYTPTLGTILTAGPGQTLRVDFVPNDTANYSNAAKNVTINVLRATTPISISNIPSNAVYGGSFTPTYAYTGDETKSVAPAENVVIPPGLTGTLTFTFTGSEAAGVSGFGLVKRELGRAPLYQELMDTSTEPVGRVFFSTQVHGGEQFEFFLQTNKRLIPDITPLTYSSDPAQNVAIDPAFPAHMLLQQRGNNIWVLNWEDKNSRDPGFDADLNDVVVTLQVQPVRCDNVTIPCPGIDDATSNHNVNRVDPALERSVASPVALAIGASGTTRQGSTVLTQTTTCTGSSVDNLRFSYMQESIDYQTMVQPKVGVGAACGAALSGGSGGLPELKIHRFHRPRETAVWSSFGPGVFSNFDTKIQLITMGLGNQPNVILFDATSDTPLLTFFELSPEDGDQAVDGVYHEIATRAWKALELFNAKGVRTGSQNDAVIVILTAHTGERWVFEVIRTRPGDVPLLYGRLIRLEDPNQNAVVVSYVYGAQASSAELGFDSTRSRLWQIQTVTDAFGVSARFHYADVLVGGRWAVDRIELPNGGQLRYRYRQELPQRVTEGPFLREVIHPDGTQSRFTLRFDPNMQLVVMGFDDSAEGPSQSRKEVFVTPSQALLPNGNVVNQTPNLVRRVVNGDGELVYRNWEDPADAHIIYFYEGGVLHRLTTREDGFPVAYARAVFYRVGQDPRSATFETIETYDANSRQMLTARQDAFGRVQQLTRDDGSRAVVGLKLPDGSTVQATYNAFRKPLQVTDRLGRIAEKTYDARGNILTSTVAKGSSVEATSRLGYNSRGQVTQSTDANGNTTEYMYEARGRLVAQIEPADSPREPRARTTFAYDRAGRLVSRSDAEGRTIRFDYDLRNRVTAIHYPDGSQQRFRFGQDQDANLLIAQTDRNGNEQRFVYDRTKRLVDKIMAVGKPEEVRERTTYVPGTPLVSTTVQRGEQTDYERDGRNRLTATVVHVSGGRTLRTSTVYDVLDRVVQRTDPYGRSKFLVYDVNDRLMHSVIELVPGSVQNGANPATLPRDESLNPGYVIEDTVFDSMGQVTDTINGRGIATRFAYDGQGRRVEQVEAADTGVAARTHRDYDPRGNLIRVMHPRTFTEGRPFVTTYSYTGRNLPRTVMVAAGTPDEATTKTRYTPTGKRAEMVDARGNVTRFRYDSCCDRLTEMQDPTGAVTRYAYDPYGNRVSVVDANGNKMVFKYDGLHRLTAQTNGEGETTRFEYDDDLTDGRGLEVRFGDKIGDLGFARGADGVATLITNALHETTLIVADSLGRTVRTVDGNGNATTTKYDTVAGGLLETTRIDVLGHAWRNRQDGVGRERQRIDPEDQLTTAVFDAAGNRVGVLDADGVGEDCLFDLRNRSTSCQDTKGNTRQMRYDAHSNSIALIDGLGAKTTNHFDFRDRRTSSTDRLGGITLYTYDASSNLVRMVDAERNATVYEYDARNLRIRETFPSSGKELDTRLIRFDPGRRLASRTDQAGDRVEYNYDHANRLTRRRYPDRLDDVFAYDQASRLIAARSQRYETVVQRQYDHGGRLTAELQQVLGEDHVLRYTYDRANRQTQVQYPNGSVVERTFTARNQLETVFLDGSPIASRGYSAGMRLLETTLGNGLIDRRDYDRDGLLSALEVSNVTTFAYNYDANKWKTEERVMTSPGESQDFRYDAEGRLNSWARDDAQTQTWNLSVVGDWEQIQRDGAIEARTHNAVHELTSLNGKALFYDPKGNLVRDDEKNRYGWDFENRLMQARDADAREKEVTYFYDALGRRLGKATRRTTTVFVHDGNQVVAEYENRRIARRYVYGSYVDEPLALSTEGGVFFYTANHLYSVAALTDSYGRVIERYRYDAYGSRTVTEATGGVRPESSVGNQIGFTGRYHDADSGLIDFRSRQYDPRLGRFIGRDQSYLDGMSLYAAYFVPNGTDPSGAEGLCATTGQAAFGFIQTSQPTRSAALQSALFVGPPEESCTTRCKQIACYDTPGCVRTFGLVSGEDEFTCHRDPVCNAAFVQNYWECDHEYCSFYVKTIKTGIETSIAAGEWAIDRASAVLSALYDGFKLGYEVGKIWVKQLPPNPYSRPKSKPKSTSGTPGGGTPGGGTPGGGTPGGGTPGGGTPGGGTPPATGASICEVKYSDAIFECGGPSYVQGWKCDAEGNASYSCNKCLKKMDDLEVECEASSSEARGTCRSQGRFHDTCTISCECVKVD